MMLRLTGYAVFAVDPVPAAAVRMRYILSYGTLRAAAPHPRPSDKGKKVDFHRRRNAPSGVAKTGIGKVRTTQRVRLGAHEGAHGAAPIRKGVLKPGTPWLQHPCNGDQ